MSVCGDRHGTGVSLNIKSSPVRFPASGRIDGLSRYLFVLVASLVFPLASSAQPRAQGQQPVAETKPPPEPVVLATVDENPIYAGEVQSLLAAIPRQEMLKPKQRAQVEAVLLNQLIGQRLVVKYLRRIDEFISAHHVDAAVEDLRDKLAQQKRKLEDHLQRKGITESALRAEIEWRMSWKRYVTRRVTDKVLEDYFEDHRADYDGRQLRLQHLLLKLAAGDGEARHKEVISKAAKIREQIVAGQLSFDEAVARHSQAPSSDNAGDVGFVHRHGQLTEQFLAAGFRLKPGEISPPVTTQFGVHLIRCAEIKPGQKKWSDVGNQLRSAVIRRGFKKIVQNERKNAKVSFTGRGPYLDPEKNELVVPEKNEQ